MTSARVDVSRQDDDVSEQVPARGSAWRRVGGAWRRVTETGGAWRRVTHFGGAWWRVQVTPRILVARAGDAENSGGACRRVEGPMKTKFHRKADRGDYFPMMLSVV